MNGRSKRSGERKMGEGCRLRTGDVRGLENEHGRCERSEELEIGEEWGTKTGGGRGAENEKGDGRVVETGGEDGRALAMAGTERRKTNQSRTHIQPILTSNYGEKENINCWWERGTGMRSLDVATSSAPRKRCNATVLSPQASREDGTTTTVTIAHST